MGPYYITALVNLLGGISRVYGAAHTSFETRLITAPPHAGEIIHVHTPTHIEALLHFERGITGSLLTSFDMYQTRQTNIEIYGTEGTLTVPDPNGFGGTVTFCGTDRKAREYPLAFDYADNFRCLGLDDMAAAIEQGRPGRTTYRQTFHVLEAMSGILLSAKSGEPYTMTSRFVREAPMDPALPHGFL
jgi:predicted dehydrogenase